MVTTTVAACRTCYKLVSGTGPTLMQRNSGCYLIVEKEDSICVNINIQVQSHRASIRVPYANILNKRVNTTNNINNREIIRMKLSKVKPTRDFASIIT